MIYPNFLTKKKETFLSPFFSLFVNLKLPIMDVLYSYKVTTLESVIELKEHPPKML
jgi:hypothetical protein